MLIVALQDSVDDLYAIYDTVIDRFLGVNLSKCDAIEKIISNKGCNYETALSRVENPQSFIDIVNCLN